VKSEEYHMERGIVGEDIHEGKRTLMVAKAIWDNNVSSTTKKRLIEILDMKTQDEELLREGIEILSTSGAIEYAENQAKIMME
jgi:geranylgeranyl pyrophosphate synthase